MSDNVKTKVMLETLHEIVDELDYYQLLRIEQSCDQADISAAFRKESQTLHPDRSRSIEDMKEKSTYIYTAINEAFRVLKDPDSRLIYDNLIKKGQIRVEDTALKATAETNKSNDPSAAATTEKSKKYWSLALSDFDAKRFESCILNIKFAIQFEPDNEVFKEWLEKAKVAEQNAPKKEKNPYKLRI